MRWKKNWYVVHRWLGLVVSVQLLAWSIGGFMFSWLDIDNVRGELERSNQPQPSLRNDRITVSPAGAIDAAATYGIANEAVCSLRLRSNSPSHRSGGHAQWGDLAPRRYPRPPSHFRALYSSLQAQSSAQPTLHSRCPSGQRRRSSATIRKSWTSYTGEASQMPERPDQGDYHNPP